MPEIRFADAKHALACKLAERGIVLTSRRLKDFTAIFVERMRLNAITLDDLDRYVLDFWDETGETAVRNVMAEAAA